MSNKTAPITPGIARGFSKLFGKIADELIVAAWKVRARVRTWNYFTSSREWSTYVLPSVQVSRGLDSAFRYRLFVGWAFWGFDCGLCPPKRVLIHDGKGFTYLDTRPSPPQMKTHDRDPLTEEYHPDEANERP